MGGWVPWLYMLFWDEGLGGLGVQGLGFSLSSGSHGLTRRVQSNQDLATRESAPSYEG